MSSDYLASFGGTDDCLNSQMTGPNGGGKSTLARAITGMIPLQKGAISWNGKDLTGLSVDERARLLFGTRCRLTLMRCCGILNCAIHAGSMHSGPMFGH